MISVFDLPRLRAQVHARMAERGVSQRMLMLQTGVPKSTLSMQLRPEPYPTATVEVVAALLKWLGKTDITEYMLGGAKGAKGPDPSRFNWMLLRILLQEKQARHNFHAGRAALESGVNRGVYTAFLNGSRPTLTVENLLQLLAWLEIYDWRELCDE